MIRILGTRVRQLAAQIKPRLNTEIDVNLLSRHSLQWPEARSVHALLIPPLRVLISPQGKQRKGKSRDAPRQGSEDPWRTDVVEKADMRNERLDKYYKAQNILPEDEWDTFMASMRDPLPTTFRVAGSRQSVVVVHGPTFVY